jgi:hypothetical protein
MGRVTGIYAELSMMGKIARLSLTPQNPSRKAFLSFNSVVGSDQRSETTGTATRTLRARRDSSQKDKRCGYIRKDRTRRAARPWRGTPFQLWNVPHDRDHYIHWGK